MINMKKKNRILIAGLMAIAVTGASTLAYFTSTLKLAGASDNDTRQQLSITNGKVEITGKIGNQDAPANYWYYDVARVSTDMAGTDMADNELSDNAKTQLKNWMKKTGDAPGKDITCDGDKAINADNKSWYVTKNLSPDILGVGEAIGERNAKAKVYDRITGAISQARPGDAFVLGYVAKNEENSSASEGLTITNSSTITTKVSIETDASSIDELKKLTDAGWKIYSKKSDSQDWKEVKVDNSVITGLPELSLPNKDDTETINLRIELPLGTKDTYQNAVTGGKSISNFDIRNLFKIKATQENNPGWNVDGTN